ncbi:hypothetical protein EDF81_4473 [Enterobacter sp. BIGb0383]|uniref:T6SS immunity protein Tli4 family protein n=1 Tax=unclassified Enterobacter TaxID=2608935 RepID=UPI000F476A00|nr:MULTISPECIES: T6SS immunity protein Tli4 family protein [unclassified Enterobacter]ROP49461.1 hypothetical protein EDF81_4473 [Enterobacter sp. BIGb0383]ROS00663.1 hypothetical protein EC848_4355 [Enterobacter sp. BIGb0359]
MKLKKTLAVAVLLAAGFAGWCWYSFLPPQITLNNKERVNVEHFLQEMKPRCIGRYAIDLPDTFTTDPANVMAFINKSPVRYKRIYRPAFEQKVRLREAALKEEKTLNALDLPFLKKVYSLPVGMEGVIFERNDSQSRPDSARVLEAHLYTNGVAVEIEFKSRNGLSSRYNDDRQSIPELYGNNVPQRLAELINLLTRISGKKETDIPVVPGFCLPEIFIADGQEEQEESIDVIYKPSGYPMLKISFDTDNVSRPGSSLLERSVLMKQKISEAEGRTLDNGERNINGLYAEQWLAEGNTGDGIGEKAFRFAVNIHEKTAGPTTPRLSVSFVQRGLEGNGLLSENEAISVWQTITDTLRMRPGAY